MDVVFHTAALPGVWGTYRAFYETNVRGTRNVIDACFAEGVTRLVYTSSPSITFAGHDQEGTDESDPYSERFLAHYPRTKAAAERLVLAANCESLATVALRPHLIWGPDDTQLVPRVIERARKGRLRLVGDGSKLVDATYIDNAAMAHLLAADRLSSGAACAGKAYYISNGEPWPMARIINGILAAAGLPPVTRSVSPAAAYALGAVLEAAYAAFRLSGEPLMTRFVTRQLATAHWYDISAARRDLGYKPSVTMDEAMRRLGESLRR